MHKRGLIILLVLLILLNATSIIGTNGGTATSDDGIGGSGTEETATGVEQTNDFFKQNNIPGSAGPGTQVLASDAGSITITGQVTINGQQYEGTNLVIDTSGNIGPYGELTMPNGAKASNGNGAKADGKDKYSLNQVGELNQGTIVLSNAQNVVFDNGMLTAATAGQLDYHGSRSTDITMLVADNKKFSVGQAESVQAGCFLVEDVENAEFNVGKIMTMTTSGEGKIVYDQGQRVEYTAKDLNSSIVGSITACRRPTYQVKAMELNTKTGNFTELVNGSGEVQLDGRYGVVCLNLTPVSTYDIDTGKYEDSFGFIIKEYAYKLCIQKAVAQNLVADCPLCGLVDLANNVLTLNGVIEYTRYLYDSALIDSNKRTAFKSMGMGKNIIDLGKKEVMISKDAPEITTEAGNYLLLKEISETPTHRFLGINEKLDRVSANWASKYTAVYSDSKTTIVDNMLDYTRAQCHVAVLPPESPQISAIISSLNEQQARYQ
jgi:hypothetical protein